jgi:hypothetical protein
VVSRRDILMAAVVSPAAARAAQSGGTQVGGGKDFIYDYLFVEVPPGPGTSSQDAFVPHLRDAASNVQKAGGEAIGYFTPFIGWSSQNIAVLLRWGGSTSGREQVVRSFENKGITARVDRSMLAATVRPGGTDLPRTTGIYTHRWFDVKTSDIPEFIDRSNSAWPFFEKEFPAKVFGLFRAEQSPQDRRRGVTRMLLNTWYESHAVWESSRKPSSEPTALFKRRAQLTLTTRVASLHFNPLTS